jgi:hypothetical protein
MRQALSVAASAQTLEEDVDRDLRHLHQKADAFTLQLADTVQPAILSKAETFHFLGRLVNYQASMPRPALKYDTHVDFFLSDAELACHRDHLAVGDVCVRVLTMKDPPAQTFAYVLQDLTAVPGPFIGCDGGAWAVHRLPGVAADPERHHAARPTGSSPPLLQSEGVLRQLPEP